MEVFKVVNGIRYIIRPIHQFGFRREVLIEPFTREMEIILIQAIRAPFFGAARIIGISQPWVFQARG